MSGCNETPLIMHVHNDIGVTCQIIQTALKQVSNTPHRDKANNVVPNIVNMYNFLIFAQNIDCGYTLEPPHRCGSNEYPQSMFSSKNKKIMNTPVNPIFSILKWGVRGYTLHGHVSMMDLLLNMPRIGEAAAVVTNQTPIPIYNQISKLQCIPFPPQLQTCLGVTKHRWSFMASRHGGNMLAKFRNHYIQVRTWYNKFDCHFECHPEKVLSICLKYSSVACAHT